MAAESRPFPNFDGPCPDLGSRLALANRSAFGLPVPSSPFVAHFYPVVNSVGPAPPLQASDPPHIQANPGNIFPQGRPDLLYTELYRNLLKSASKQISEGSKNFSLYPDGRNNLSCKDVVDQRLPKRRKEDSLELPENDSRGGHGRSGLPSPFVPSSLRSFYEGIYTQLTPNHSDYLLRIRAEQQLALKKTGEFRRKEPSPHGRPYADATERHFGISSLDSVGVFRPSTKSQWSAPTSSQETLRPSPVYDRSPRGERVEKSPIGYPGTAPLEYSLEKYSRSPPYSEKYSPIAGDKAPRLDVTYAPFNDKEPTRVSESSLEYFNFKSTEMSSATELSSPAGESRFYSSHSPKNMDSEFKEKPQDDVTAQTKVTTISSPALANTDSNDDVIMTSDTRIKRKRRLTSSAETCPVCGITVRAFEMKQHFSQEVLRLEKISLEVIRNNRRNSLDRRSSASSTGCVAGTSVTPTTSKKQVDQVGPQSQTRENRLKTFQKVCGNRLDRFNSRVGRGHATMWRNGVLPAGAHQKMNGNAWAAYNQSILAQTKMTICGGRFENVHCPVCNVSLSHLANHDQISDHVVSCAGATQGGNTHFSRIKNERMEEEEVDIEAADDSGTFGEEYEWCGETRIRATALAHRDLLASTPGFQVIQATENDDSDQDLNVETDETGEFGGAQFTDNDLVVPCPSGDDTPTSSSANLHETLSPGTSNLETQLPCNSRSLQSPSVVVQALRLKIQELESEKRSSRCLICMEPHKDPLVSIQCWHVHCHECWMRALGVKKLCPQCNMITPASQLRRIYL